jgi:hypothetical protein
MSANGVCGKKWESVNQLFKCRDPNLLRSEGRHIGRSESQVYARSHSVRSRTSYCKRDARSFAVRPQLIDFGACPGYDNWWHERLWIVLMLAQSECSERKSLERWCEKNCARSQWNKFRLVASPRRQEIIPQTRTELIRLSAPVHKSLTKFQWVTQDLRRTFKFRRAARLRWYHLTSCWMPARRMSVSRRSAQQVVVMISHSLRQCTGGGQRY